MHGPYSRLKSTNKKNLHTKDILLKERELVGTEIRKAVCNCTSKVVLSWRILPPAPPAMQVALKWRRNQARKKGGGGGGGWKRGFWQIRCHPQHAERGEEGEERNDTKLLRDGTAKETPPLFTKTMMPDAASRRRRMRRGCQIGVGGSGRMKGKKKKNVSAISPR